MPARNSIKIDVEGAYYHIYNRGVEKRVIFQDEQDYKVFLNYLKEYLSPPPKTETVLKTFTLQGSTFKGIPYLPNNYFGEVELLVFCLMPNHFHFLILQKVKGSMKSLMKSLSTRYAMYFNKKYDRVGPLFQGIYKAVSVLNEEYLLHLSRYIHLNPAKYSKDLTKCYSSYGDYIGIRKTMWINSDLIKSYFSKDIKKITSYKMFVESQIENDEFLRGYTLD